MPTAHQFPRAAGIAVPLFALRGAHASGTGEILDLIPFIDWMARWHQRVVQLLPINETAIGETSPYNTLSAFAIDPAYITPWKVPEIEGHPAAQVLASSPRVRAHTRRWPAARQRQRRSAYVLKLQLLESAFEVFQELPAASERVARFNRYCAENAWWLDDYALFRALKERRRWTNWENWSEPLRAHDAAAVARAAAACAHRMRFFRYVQWVAAEQWDTVRTHARHRGVLLKGDLSFVCGRDSADVWAHQDLFDLGSSAGAPPDAFSATGQAWGLPLYDWAAMRRSDYGWWRQRARQGRQLFDLFRIDHVVGLYRTYAIPLREGGSVGFIPHVQHEQVAQGNDLLTAVLEEAGESGVIAEDLGTVPDWVRTSLTALGIPGYKVFRWERNDGGFIDPRSYASLSVCTTGTHDTDTLITWWDTLPADERRGVVAALDLSHAGVGPVDPAAPWTAALHLALLRRLYEAGSTLTILPIQDLFGWPERINTPATTDAHNWTYRLPVEIGRLDEVAEVRARMEQISAMIDDTGRWVR